MSNTPREPLLLFSHRLEMENCLEAIRFRTSLPFRAERVGIGPSDARGKTEWLLDQVRTPSAVLSLGSAGWLKEGPVPGKPIWAREVKNERRRTLRPTIRLQPSDLGGIDLFSARVVTVSRVVKDVDRASWLATEIGAEAVDMESFAIFDVCTDADVECAAIRAVTDRATSTVITDYRDSVEQTMMLVGERVARLITVLDKREQRLRGDPKDH